MPPPNKEIVMAMQDSQHAKPLQLQTCPATDGDTTMMTVINVELDKLFQDQQASSQMHPTPLEAVLYAAARSNDRQTAKYLIEKVSISMVILSFMQ